MQVTFHLGLPPSPSLQPEQELEISEGSDIELSAPSGLAAIPTPSFQWLLDGLPIPNAVGPRFKVIQPGAYAVLISDSIGQATSKIATLSALRPMRISTPRLSASGRSLILELTGNPGQSYVLGSTANLSSWQTGRQSWMAG
ncbi:MAG: immunoglobulin domain-containing protein [Verrucomicrobiales bacterium]|nr:immunoglobulin domain-containing protein [Verrucomicrobiales bacterium]